MSRKLYSVDPVVQAQVANVTSTTSTTTIINNTSNTVIDSTELVPGIVTINENNDFDNIDAIRAVADDAIFQDLTVTSNLLVLNDDPQRSGFNLNTTAMHKRQQIGIIFPYKQTGPTQMGFMGFINNIDDVTNVYTEFLFLKKSNNGNTEDITDTELFITTLNSLNLSSYLADVHCSRVKGNSIILQYYDKDHVITTSIVLKTFFRTPHLIDVNDIVTDYNIVMGINSSDSNNFIVDIRDGSFSVG